MSAGREQVVDVPLTDPLTERTGFLADEVGLLLLHAVQARLAGPTSQTSFVLVAIDRDEPSSQQDLLWLLGIDPPACAPLSPGARPHPASGMP